MDEFSKSGPYIYRAEANIRAKESLRLMQEGLAFTVEADFIEFLREKLEVLPGDPRYLVAIKLWRSRHA